MKKQTKCYLYTRVSTSIQVDGYSLDAQREKLRKYAAYEDMTIAGEYSDEGFSGKNIQGRPDFQRMMEDIQSGKDGVSYVLVFKLSRCGRAEFSADHAGLWRQSDLRGGRHRQLQGRRQADDFGALCRGGD